MDIRFNILNDYVHKFVIVESLFSHSGRKKPLNFNINNFSKFKDKIEYLVIENEPSEIIKSEEISSAQKRINSLLRIEQSYDYMMKFVNKCSDNDLICLSDNDEIPNFTSKEFKKSNKDIIIFKQLFFYYKFNLLYTSLPWFGTKACKKKKLKSLSWLRYLKNKKYSFWRFDTLFSKNKHINLDIIDDGGWHFTNLKTAEEIFEKYSNFGHHNEFDESGVSIKSIQECIDNRIVNYDHFSDKTSSNKYNASYKLDKINDSLLPTYLINNKKKYINWFDVN